MPLDDKVLLGRLYERTSQKGNRYFSGLFKDDNVWQLFVQDGGEKSPQVAQEREGPTKMARVPRSGRRPLAGLGRPPRGIRSKSRFSTTRYRTHWHEGTHGT